jgi:hypothetical protein
MSGCDSKSLNELRREYDRYDLTSVANRFGPTVVASASFRNEIFGGSRQRP